MIRRTFAVLAIIGALASQSVANETGNDLLDACEGSHEWMQGWCFGFILGTVEGMGLGGFLTLLHTPNPDIDVRSLPEQEATDIVRSALKICIPPSVTTKQIADVVKVNLAQNPATRHKTARFLVRKALIDAFPCPERN